MRWSSPTISAIPRGVVPNRWDLLAVPLVLSVFFLFAAGAHEMTGPLTAPQGGELSLDPSHLPYYALRTTLRMMVAMAGSLIFTFTYATAAAKSRRAELILVPVLDVLQSVPVLGYVSFTVTFFLALFPGNVLGAEFAAIFAIFTSQAWNMAFSFYQSLRTVPKDLVEVSASFRFSGWQKFWFLEVPFAIPGLIWNMMMSMSGGWFFVVASEAIAVGTHTVRLPGIGSYVALAIDQKDLGAIGWALLTMLVVILAYDQLFFRPLIAWTDKFRCRAQRRGGGAAILAAPALPPGPAAEHRRQPPLPAAAPDRGLAGPALHPRAGGAVAPASALAGGGGLVCGGRSPDGPAALAGGRHRDRPARLA